MSAAEGGGSPAPVQDLQDAGKAVVDAAGAVAVDRAKAEVDVRSSRVAVELKAFAVAMRESTQSLREQGHDGQAELMDEVAGRADRLAAHLATSTTDDLVQEAKELASQAAAFAKKEPMLVIAGAFTLGLLVPKVLGSIADEP
jgi:ElaB/YqjD/DUF883 family membrane-anchored ribosome-binding protein